MIAWLRNPWGRPRGLVLVTGLYVAWSILPVGIAILFAFNSGRSRTTLQGIRSAGSRVRRASSTIRRCRAR